MKIFKIMVILILCIPAVCSAFNSEYYIGDVVVFLYWGNDSKKDVKNRGVITEVHFNRNEKVDYYVINPEYPLTPFGGWVNVKPEKIIERCCDVVQRDK